jgi:hypothetical protein
VGNLIGAWKRNHENSQMNLIPESATPRRTT